jgi:hypothetical protein
MSSSTQESPSSSSSNGLQLNISLNANSIQAGKSISARVQIENTLDQNVSVVVPPTNQTVDLLNQTLSTLNFYDFTCAQNPSRFLVNFNLFPGHYTAGNISEAGAPLQVAVPVIPPGCALENYPLKFTFLPDGVYAVGPRTSDSSSPPVQYLTVNASIDITTTYCGPNPPPENGLNCGLGQGLVGYWHNGVSTQGDLSFTSPAFTYFSPGEYTILAYDMWGQRAYATFVVD